MSIEETEYFRMQSFKWHKNLLKDQDRLVQTFGRTGNGRQLRRSFYNLRCIYLENCLTAYADDLGGTGLDLEPHRIQLLQTKLAFYITRFAEDSQRLFPKQQVRNGYMVFRFAKTGNKLVAQLAPETEGN